MSERERTRVCARVRARKSDRMRAREEGMGSRVHDKEKCCVLTCLGMARFSCLLSCIRFLSHTSKHAVIFIINGGTQMLRWHLHLFLMAEFCVGFDFFNIDLLITCHVHLSWMNSEWAWKTRRKGGERGREGQEKVSSSKQVGRLIEKRGGGGGGTARAFCLIFSLY